MGSLTHIQSWAASMKKSPSWDVLVDSARSAASGAAFGAALTAAGVHVPAVIVNQFRLVDFRMFHVFTVALGSSVFIIFLLDRLDIVKRHVRPSTSLGLFSSYDANIIGGALVGVGMSMSGSCPGTVTAQLAQGIPTAGITAFGGLLGGMAYLWFDRAVLQTHPSSPPPAERATPLSTIATASGLSETTLYALFATITGSLLYISASSKQPFLHTQSAGGLFLGMAQLMSLLFTSTALGASGIYDQAGRYAWRALGNKEIDVPSTPPKSLMFAAGAVLGSALLTSPPAGNFELASSPVSLLSALIGGTLMAFGAKMAKGCTSGHGLSGLGALSTSSLITVASMFGAGIAYQFL